MDYLAKVGETSILYILEFAIGMGDKNAGVRRAAETLQVPLEEFSEWWGVSLEQELVKLLNFEGGQFRFSVIGHLHEDGRFERLEACSHLAMCWPADLVYFTPALKFFSHLVVQDLLHFRKGVTAKPAIQFYFENLNETGKNYKMLCLIRDIQMQYRCSATIPEVVLEFDVEFQDWTLDMEDLKNAV